MTWKDLAKQINDMTEEQQNTDVTVLLMNSDEVFGVLDFVTVDWHDDDVLSESGYTFGLDKVSGVLDEGHRTLRLGAVAAGGCD